MSESPPILPKHPSEVIIGGGTLATAELHGKITDSF